MHELLKHRCGIFWHMKAHDCGGWQWKLNGSGAKSSTVRGNATELQRQITSRKNTKPKEGGGLMEVMKLI